VGASKYMGAEEVGALVFSVSAGGAILAEGLIGEVQLGYIRVSAILT
jgi:hypothetical protein